MAVLFINNNLIICKISIFNTFWNARNELLKLKKEEPKVWYKVFPKCFWQIDSLELISLSKNRSITVEHSAKLDSKSRDLQKIAFIYINSNYNSITYLVNYY